MTLYIKPNGNEIEVNDDSVSAKADIEALGWKKKEKRQRRTKAEMEAARADVVVEDE